MLRLLHIADVHFDTTFRCRTEAIRSRLREAIRESFVRATDVAIHERVHAVLIAGDLFDGRRLSFTTEKVLRDQFLRLKSESIDVFYACGNHDPASPPSQRTRGFNWPDNCTVFDSSKPSSFEVRDSEGHAIGRIIGAGHESHRERDNLASRFPRAKDDLPHVGLLHTMVTSASAAESHDRYAPCGVTDLISSDYDYWALGHIHHRQAVDQEGKIWYPGNTQGRNPKETGQRGGLLVEVSRGRSPDVEFVPLASIEWLSLRLVGLRAVRDLADLEREVGRVFDSRDSSTPTENIIVVVDLEGECPMADSLRSRESVDEVEDILADYLSVLAVEIRSDALRQPSNVEGLREKPHVLGEVLGLIARLESKEDTIERVAPSELAGLVRESDERDAYLHALLDGLEQEAIQRLLREDR